MGEKRYHFNLIDAAVLVLVLAVLVFGIVKLVSRSGQSKAPTEPAPISGPGADFSPNLRFEVTAYDLEKDLAERILAEPANRIYNGYKLYDAYIVDGAIEPMQKLVLDAEGQAVPVEDPTRVMLRLTVEAYIDPLTLNAEIEGNFNALLGAQEVRLGKPYTLKTMTVELPTTVTRLEAPYGG